MRLTLLVPFVLSFASPGLTQTTRNLPDGGGYVVRSPSDVAGTSAWHRLILDGHELHSSLRTQQVSEPIRHLPSHIVLPRNPYASTETEFIDAVVGSSSQGKLAGDGVRSAFYAFYAEEKDLGFYGLEATSTLDADWREVALNKTWAKNMSLDRVRIHRKGLLLVVVRHDGVSPDCWASVNAGVAERLAAR